jgi:ribose transport system substrate-binding protein
MKPDVNYFPNLPDTYETVASYVDCGISFTPQEVNKFLADNN